MIVNLDAPDLPLNETNSLLLENNERENYNKMAEKIRNKGKFKDENAGNLMKEDRKQYIVNKLTTDLYLFYLCKKYNQRSTFFIKSNPFNNIGLFIHSVDNDFGLMDYKKYALHVAKEIMNATDIIIVPITIMYQQGFHANVLIYKKFLNSFEHFEPHGKVLGGESGILAKKGKRNVITNLLQEFVRDVNTMITSNHREVLYTSSVETSLNLSDIIEIDEVQKIYFTGPQHFDLEGYCALWCILMSELSLKYPTLSLSELNNKNIRSVIKHNGNLLSEKIDKFINGYSVYINRTLYDYFHGIFEFIPNTHYLQNKKNNIELLNELYNVEYLCITSKKTYQQYIKKLKKVKFSLFEYSLKTYSILDALYDMYDEHGTTTEFIKYSNKYNKLILIKILELLQSKFMDFETLNKTQRNKIAHLFTRKKI